ncbi:MAG TPA: hypothetical protein VFT02_04125 [Pyrinomonadaceae bacterium]|nr:hypothetical protein [Pyrinomonadaceae bacterium]
MPLTLPKRGRLLICLAALSASAVVTRRQGDELSIRESQLLDSWADFLVGMAAQGAQGGPTAKSELVSWKQYALYARDTTLFDFIRRWIRPAFQTGWCRSRDVSTVVSIAKNGAELRGDPKVSP